MALREADDDYLEQVGRWWGELLPRMAPYLHQRGGPIILVQARFPGTCPCRPPALAPTCAAGPSSSCRRACMAHPCRPLPHPHQRGGPIIFVQARLHGTCPCRPPAPALTCAAGPSSLCRHACMAHAPAAHLPRPHHRRGPIILMQARLLGTPLPPTCPALTCAAGPSSPLAQRTPGIPSFHCLCRVCGVQEMHGHVEASAAKGQCRP